MTDPSIEPDEGGGGRKVQVTFSLPSATLARLDELTHAKRRSRSALVGMAVDEYLARQAPPPTRVRKQHGTWTGGAA